MSVSLLGSSALNKKNLSNLIIYNDKSKATELSLWDRFVDLFKSYKKQDVVNTFYTLIHGGNNNIGTNEENNKFYCFEQLKRLADVDHQHLFEVHVERHSVYTSKYTFSIDGDDILSFFSERNGCSLTELSVDKLPLVDNYEFIVYNYMKSNQERFLIDYKDTKANVYFSADELMDYSCFFLKNNHDVRKAFLEHGLINMDVMDILRDDMNNHCPLEDNRRDYVLTVITSSLRSLNQLSSDCM